MCTNLNTATHAGVCAEILLALFHIRTVLRPIPYFPATPATPARHTSAASPRPSVWRARPRRRWPRRSVHDRFGMGAWRGAPRDLGGALLLEERLLALTHPRQLLLEKGDTAGLAVRGLRFPRGAGRAVRNGRVVWRVVRGGPREHDARLLEAGARAGRALVRARRNAHHCPPARVLRSAAGMGAACVSAHPCGRWSACVCGGRGASVDVANLVRNHEAMSTLQLAGHGKELLRELLETRASMLLGVRLVHALTAHRFAEHAADGCLQQRCILHAQQVLPPLRKPPQGRLDLGCQYKRRHTIERGDHPASPTRAPSAPPAVDVPSALNGRSRHDS